MDAFELESMIREKTGLLDEKILPTPVLTPFLNMGYLLVCNRLLPMFKEHLIRSVTVSDTSSSEVIVPGDCMTLLNVDRLKADGSAYREAVEILVENRRVIGTVNYPADDEENPLYMNLGRKVEIWPERIGGMEVMIEFRRRITDLFWERTCEVTTSTITMQRYVSALDDVYNDMFVALYQLDNNVLKRIGVYRCTDYTAGTKVLTLNGDLSSYTSAAIWAALVPVLPEAFHPLVIQATIVEMMGNKTLQSKGIVEADPEAAVKLEKDLTDLTGEDNE